MVKKKRKASTMRRLHRSFGAFAALFVLFMVLSGVTINHSNSLGLDQTRVSQSFVLDWYGLGKPSSIHSYAVGDHWLSFAGSQLYLDDRLVATISSNTGAVSNGDLLIAAGSDELLLLDMDGNLIERQSWDVITRGPIESIGLHASTRVIVKSGGKVWSADPDFLNWDPTKDVITSEQWSGSTSAPETLQKAITREYRGEGLSLERVLLDLHSGRIFGSVGVLVYDLIALGLGFLSISGLVLWFRSRRNGNGRSNGRK